MRGVCNALDSSGNFAGHNSKYDHQVTKKINDCYSPTITESIFQKNQRELYKQDFLKSKEGVEMVSSLFSQIISNKITDPSISSVIIKIVKFDPLLSPKDLNDNTQEHAVRLSRFRTFV